MKCAFTSSDGTTQLYAEKELFDDSASKAIYHVKVTSVSSSAGTDIYYYYDNDASDNTTYIGAINTTAGGHVWDSNFKAVYHMTDATTSTVVDSTSNNNDGTKKGANEPIEATGKLSKGQSFDGSNDYINFGDISDIEGGHITISFLTYLTDLSGYLLFCKDDWDESFNSHFYDNNTLYWGYSATGDRVGGTTNIFTLNTWQHIVLWFDGSYWKTYTNSVEKQSASSTISSIPNTATDLTLGIASGVFTGIIDEIRISSTNRSAAWIKATYNSLWDSLVSYSAEETKPSADNALFWFNF